MSSSNNNDNNEEQEEDLLINIPTDTEHEQRKTEQTLSKRYLVNAPSNGCKVDTLARARHLSWLTEKLQQSSSSPHLDSSRPWLVYWPLHAMDLMKGINSRLMNQPLPSSSSSSLCGSLAEGLFEWIFRCFTYVEDSEETKNQKHPTSLSSSSSSRIGGFSGGWRQVPHLASCWAACASLIILSDEVPKLRPKLKDRLDRTALTNWLASLRTRDGGFRMFTRGEVDLRATYCAACVATIFDLDAEKIFPVECLEFIGRCQSLDGGISSNIHGSEGHGGYVSCGFLALLLMHCLRENQKRRREKRAQEERAKEKKKMTMTMTKNGATGNESVMKSNDDNEGEEKTSTTTAASPILSSSLLFEKYFLDTRQLRRWCALRQDPCTGGFSGRVNKLVDSCYSWWVGGAMSALALVDAVEDIISEDNNNNDPTISASVLQTMKLRSLSLVQNGFMFSEEKTKAILTELLSLPKTTVNEEIPASVGDETEDENVKQESTTTGSAMFWEDESFDDGGNFAYNQDRLAEYVLELAQTRTGGLCDKPDLCSDLYHSCYSLSGLSVSVATEEKTIIAEELGEMLNGDEASDFKVMVKKLLDEAYQFEKFDATDSLKSTPFQSTHPLLNLTRKRVKFALEFFGGRDSML